MNIPKTFNEKDIQNLLSKYGEIEKIHIKKNLFGWTSHAIVEFFKESPIEWVVKVFKDHWIGAQKVWVFTHNDWVTECFNHRTLIIGNIPTWSTPDDVIHVLRGFGNVLRIEMPHRDVNIQNLMEK